MCEPDARPLGLETTKPDQGADITGGRGLSPAQHAPHPLRHFPFAWLKTRGGGERGPTRGDSAPGQFRPAPSGAPLGLAQVDNGGAIRWRGAIREWEEGMKGLAAVAPFIVLLAACGATGTATQTPATTTQTSVAATQAPTPTPLPSVSLTGLQSSYTITDTNALNLTGSTAPNATVSVNGNATPLVVPVDVTADAQGNFTIHLTDIAMGTNSEFVYVTSPGYTSTQIAISVTRTISEAGYKASASSIPYDQLIKDPASMAGTVVTYQAQVFQYDTNTTTSHFIASVTNDGYGFWTDNIWADVDPAVAANVCTDTVIQFWGSVVGPYTYTTSSNGSLTIPEIDILYITVDSGSC